MAANVTFTSNSPAPSPGSWQGIHLIVTPSGIAPSSLTRCTVDWAGDIFALPASSASCGGALGAVFVDANGFLPATNVGPTISGCTISNYPANNYGIITADILASDVTSYMTGNTFGTSADSVCSQ